MIWIKTTCFSLLSISFWLIGVFGKVTLKKISQTQKMAIMKTSIFFILRELVKVLETFTWLIHYSFDCTQGTDTTFITYCSINANIAYDSYCIRFSFDASKYEIDKCNIVNNDIGPGEYSNGDNAVIMCLGDLIISNCCILGNTISNSPTTRIFYNYKTLTINQCYCQIFVIAGTGILDTSSITTSEFINNLKFTATAEYCFTSITEYVPTKAVHKTKIIKQWFVMFLVCQKWYLMIKIKQTVPNMTSFWYICYWINIMIMVFVSDFIFAFCCLLILLCLYSLLHVLIFMFWIAVAE